MSHLYFDTSAIVKRYTTEIGSSWVNNLFSPSSGHTVYLAEITLVEFGAALATKQRAGIITSAEQARDLGLFLSHTTKDYSLISLNRSIIDRALKLTQTYKLRGYDAVQLASSLVT